MRRITLTTLFITGLIALDWLIGSFAQWRANQAGINLFSESRMRDFYESPDKIELLFLGSSHSYRSFDPARFEAPLKMNAFNLGSSGQNPNTSYFLLREALRLKHPVKLLIIETYWEALGGEDQDFDSAAEVFYPLKWSENKYSYFFGALPFPESLKVFSSAFRYRDVLKNPRILLGLPFNNEGYQYESKGFVSKNNVAKKDTLEKNPLRGKTIRLNSHRVSMLEKTLALARSNQTKILMVTAPLPPVVMKNILGYSDFVERMNELARKYDSEYIDYNLINRDRSIFSDEHFSDFNHLNNAGVDILTREFTKQLLANQKP